MPIWEILRFSRTSVPAWALDGAELRERVESGHYAQKVVDQYHEALGYNIRGIPTFVFDNLLFSGAQPYEVFQRVMDKALENRAAAEE